MRQYESYPPERENHINKHIRPPFAIRHPIREGICLARPIQGGLYMLVSTVGGSSDRMLVRILGDNHASARNSFSKAKHISFPEITSSPT